MAANTSTAAFSSYRLDLGAQQNPVSSRRLARDVAEMVDEPYPNTKLIPSQQSVNVVCLVIDTGTRLVHMTLMFAENYPRTPPNIVVDGRPIDRHGDQLGCSLMLAYDRSTPRDAYTIETVAIHLLSIFEGETELGMSSDHVERRLQVAWRDYSCHLCGLGTRQSGLFDLAYLWTDLDAIDLDADESLLPQRIGFQGPAQPKTIEDLPNEVLNKLLEYLEVQDIVRFGKAWDYIANLVEDNVVIRDRELRCFVTKEHFTHSPLGIGVNDDSGPIIFKLKSEFDLISLTAFRDLGVRTSAYGFGFTVWLPLPLSEKHWEQVKGEAFEVLDRLAQEWYSGFRLSPDSDAMDVLIAFMDDHVVKLFTNVEGLPQISEKGLESLFLLFHLLLCLAVEEPKYARKANNMIRSFQDGSTLTEDMPSPGRILMASLISGVKTGARFMVNAVTETTTRNAHALLTRHPELLYMEPHGTASAYRIHHTFAGSLASYRALMFTHLLARTVRPASKGTTLKHARDMLFHRRGIPTSATLAYLVAETRRIMAVDSFAGFLDYLGVVQVPSPRFLSARLRRAVRECMGWDHAAWQLDQDEALVLRRTAEHWSTLPRTKSLPACPEWPPLWEVLVRARALGYYPEGTR